MPQEPIPFVPDQKTGNETLSGASPVALNVIIDASGAVRRRPGIATTTIGAPNGSVDGAPVIGVYSTTKGRTYSIHGTLPGIVQVYELLPTSRLLIGTFTADTRPMFAETEAMLVIANGRRVMRILFASNKLEELPGPPPNGSHVVANGSRLLTNDTVEDQTKVHYSAPALGSSTTGHEQWSVLNSAFGRSGFFTAESRPDPVVALGEGTNEVFIWGSTSLQVYGIDPTAVYVSQATFEYGCATPQGIIKADSQFAWMDERRRIVSSDGRQVQVISGAIQQALDDLPAAAVAACFGYRVSVGPVDVLCWTFPGDNRTFAFSLNGGWSTWRGALLQNNWAPFAVNAATSLLNTHTQFVGTSASLYGELRLDTFTDLGETIPAYIETGFLNRGTDLRKRCRCVRLKLRRGVSKAASQSRVALEFRDDEGVWSEPILVDLSDFPGENPVIELRSLGVYRTRQWRFTFHGNEEITLASASEEFDFLRQ